MKLFGQKLYMFAASPERVLWCLAMGLNTTFPLMLFISIYLGCFDGIVAGVIAIPATIMIYVILIKKRRKTMSGKLTKENLTYKKIKQNMVGKIRVTATVKTEPVKKEKGVTVRKCGFGDAL